MQGRKYFCKLLLIAFVLMLAVVIPAGADDVQERYFEVDDGYDLSQVIWWSNTTENKSKQFIVVLMSSFNYMGQDDIIGNLTITTNESDTNTITMVGENAKSLTISNGGHLTICGNSSSGSMKALIIKGSSSHKKSLINVTSGGTFTMKANSTLTGNSVGNRGGAVIVNGGTFFMEDGTITGNTAGSEGGGVYVSDGGTFEMSGGKITKNTATNHSGGGVSISKGTFTMSGGEIFENTVGMAGGGVGVYGGTFTMLGGSITKNTGGGVYISSSDGIVGTFYVAGSAEIIENGGYNLNIVSKDNGQMFIRDTFIGSIGVTHGSQQSKAELIRFATGDNGYPITAEDAKGFFADDSITYGVQLREDGLYLVRTYVEAPKQSSVWISAPSDSKLGSGILDDPNGGTVKFPEGFPFDAVTINQAGEVTQTSPSTAEDDFESQYKNNFPSANYYIIASADIKAEPLVQSDQKTRLEFTVPIEKIPDGYTVGVYHGVVNGNLESTMNEEVGQAAYDAASKAWDASNEVWSIIQECNSGLYDPSFNLEAAYYALQEAIQKANEAMETAEGAAWAAIGVGDAEACQAALNAAEGAGVVVLHGELMMEMIVEKLGYVPQGKTESGDVYAWQAEKVVEIGRSDGLIHYAVEVTGLSPFVIVAEQGGAEPAKEYNSDYVPSLDIDPITATPTESHAPILGILAGLGALVLWRRR